MSQGSGFFSNEQLLCLRSQIMVFRTLKACHFRSVVLSRDMWMSFVAAYQATGPLCSPGNADGGSLICKTLHLLPLSSRLPVKHTTAKHGDSSCMDAGRQACDRGGAQGHQGACAAAGSAYCLARLRCAGGAARGFAGPAAAHWAARLPAPPQQSSGRCRTAAPTPACHCFCACPSERPSLCLICCAGHHLL